MASPAVVLLLVVIATSYLPLFIPSIIVSDGDDDNLALNSSQSFFASVISFFTLTLIISVDVSIDFLFGLKKEGFLSFFLLVSGLWIFAVVGITTWDRGNLPLYFCAVSARDAIFGTVVLVYLYQYGGPLWRERFVIFPIILSLAGASSASAFSGNLRSGSLRNINSRVVANVSMAIFLLIFLVLMTINTIRYYYAVRKKKVWESAEYCCMFYSCLIIAVVASAALCSFLFRNNQYMGVIIHNFMIMGYAFLLTTTNIRLKEIELSALAVKVLAMKSSFVRYVSHEIRSPLQVMSTLLDLLEQRLVNVYRAHEGNLIGHSAFIDFSSLKANIQSIENIVKDSQRSCEIACHILNGLVGDDSIINLNLIICELFYLLDNALELYIRLAKTKDQEIRLTYSFVKKDEIHFNIDAKKMKQVIGNMLSNAVKFSPHGSVIEVVVSPVQGIGSALRSGGSSPIRKEKRYDCVRVLVRDQGCGISVGNQKKLFKSIIQFNPNQRQNGEGSGIGLFMSYSIMKKHGGDMGVRSLGEGKGTTFWIDIPIYYVQVKAVAPAASISDISKFAIEDIHAQEPRNTSLRVLCVDDFEAVSQTLVRSLISYRISDSVDSAGDGAQALSLIKVSLESGQPYDLVLMDFFMPVLDGPTTTKLAREMGFGGLILGLTGNALETDVMHFKNCGADDVLIKPVNMSILKNAVSDFQRSGYHRNYPLQAGLEFPARNMKNIEYIPVEPVTKSWLDIPILVASSLIAICVALHFFPFFWPHTRIFDVDVTTFQDSFDMQSRFYFAAKISSLTMAICMVCCAAVDYFYGFNRGGEAMLALSIASLLLWDIVIFNYASIHSDSVLFYSVSATRAHISLFAPTLFLYQSCKNIYTGKLLVFLTLFDGCNVTMRLYMQLDPSLRYGGYLFALTCAFISAICRTRHFVLLHRKLATQAAWLSKDYRTYVIAILLIGGDLLCILSGMIELKDPSTNKRTANQSVFMISIHAITILVVFATSRFLVLERISNINLIKNKRVLISHVSHEIRSPLNIIAMELDYLLDNVIKEFQASLLEIARRCESSIDFTVKREVVAALLAELSNDISSDIKDIVKVQHACCDAIAVVSDLLTYEKLERSCFALDCKVESLVPIVTRVVTELRSIAIWSNIRLEGIFMDSAYVYIDSSKIAYAFRNLLKYAIKIFPESCEAKVEISLHRFGSQEEATSEYCVVRRLSRRLLSYWRERYVFPDRTENHCQGNIEPSHVCVKVTHDVIEGKGLRHENILHGGFMRQESAANMSQVKEGGSEHSLGLYVCHGIVKAHEGNLRINYNHNKTIVEFIIDLPLVDDAAAKLSKAAIAESAARYGSAADALIRARRGSLQRSVTDQAVHRIVVDSWSSDPTLNSPRPEHKGEESTNDLLISWIPTPKPTTVASSPFSKIARILCVDDDDANSRLLVRVLTANGICDSAETASNGHEALQLILDSMCGTPDSRPYDVVLMDSRMPVMDGPTATRRARAAGFAGLIVGVTGAGFDDEIKYFKESGANQVLLKPVRVADIKRALREIW